MLWHFLLAFVGFLLWYLLVRPFSYWSKRGIRQKNCWQQSWQAWTSFIYRKSLGAFMLDIYRSFPDVRYSGSYQLNIPVLVVRDPELIKQVTVKSFEHFMNHRNFFDPDSDPLFGKSLLVLKDQEWRDLRNTISPVYTSSKMKYLFGLIFKVSQNFSQHFLKKNEDFNEVEMKDLYTIFANDVIASTSFGIELDTMSNPNNEFYKMGKILTNLDGFWKGIKFFSFLAFPKFSKILNLSIFPKESTEYFCKIVQENVKIRDQHKIYRPDMLNLMMEARESDLKGDQETTSLETGFATVKEESDDIGKPKNHVKLTNEDLNSLAINFFFAGFDMISTALSFGSYELALNLDKQQILREEIWKTLEECKGNITYENLLKMKYMDMVITEILRKWPPVNGMDRVCTKPYTIEPKNPGEVPVHLDVGDVLIIPYLGLQRDSTYYPDPDKFIPERFSDDRKSEITPYTFMPFGSGPRNCIASRFAILELKCLFFNFLKDFEIVPTKKTQIPLRFSRTALTNTAEKGFWLGLKKLTKKDQ